VKRAPKRTPKRTAASSRSAGSSGTARAKRRLGEFLPETITTRTLVLSVVVLLVFVLVVPTAREYAKQTAQLGALHTELTQAQQQRDEGKIDLKRWSDPAFVKAQARARLGYVMPGDKAYRVTDPGVATAGVSPVTGAVVTAGVVPTTPGDHGAWYQKAWTSVEVAGAGVAPH
jgi:cell division protein FtsB